MKIPAKLVVPIWIAIIAVIAGLVSLVAKWFGAYNPQAWFFFTLVGIIGSFIVFVFARQIWWFVWGSEKGDYPGREGLFKKLVLLIFPKLRK